MDWFVPRFSIFSFPFLALLRDSNAGIYASSKAAINLVSETMRLELGLLHVRVISVITGFVASNFHANRSYRLPPASPYHSYEEEIVATLNDLPANVMTAEEVGSEVAQEALRGKSGEVYIGTQAWAGKWVLPYLPSWLKDYLFLTRLSRLLARRKARSSVA
jgi:1-acylglycerone phosphate reductase